MKNKIFISYSPQERDLAKLLIQKLKEKGFETRRRSKSSQNVDWVDSLRASLQDSSLFISLVTENYVKSKYGLVELGGALGLDKKVLPVLVSGTEEKIPIMFRNFKMLDAQNMSDTDLVNLVSKETEKLVLNGQAVAVA